MAWSSAPACQAHAMTPAKLSSSQTTAGKLRHDLFDFGSPAPPLHYYSRFFVHP